MKRLEEGGNQLSTPKSRYRTCRKKIILENFDEEAIRKKIYMMYEHVTLEKLLVNLIKQYMYYICIDMIDMIQEILKEDNLFDGETTSLHRLLQKIGFW